MVFDHPVNLWENPDFMEQVRQIVEVKYQETPEHCSNLCGYVAKAYELAGEEILKGANPHDMSFLVHAQIFAMGYEAAIHNIATREHE